LYKKEEKGRRRDAERTNNRKREDAGFIPWY